MNTKRCRLIPALLLLLGLGLPAGAISVRMPGAASRAAVRAQVPVVMNAYFAAPTPLNGAALLSALSLTGSDPRINQAVRLRVADVLSAIDIEATRVANAPGAADMDNAIAQSNMQSVIAYRSQILETLQLPHVAQHLTKAQREDITARAAAAGVALTPDKAAALVARAQAEIEKLIAGTREAESVEAGASGGHVGATPRGSKLGKHVPQDPAAMARAAIPSPAALAAHQEKGALRNTQLKLGISGLGANVLAVGAVLAGQYSLFAAAAVAMIFMGIVGLLTAIPATRRFGISASRALPYVLTVASGFAISQLLQQYAPPGIFDAVAALILGGFAVAAGRGARPGMSMVFRLASAVSLFSALGAFFPGLPEATALMISVGAFIMTSLASRAPSASRLGLFGAVTAAGAARDERSR